MEEIKVRLGTPSDFARLAAIISTYDAWTCKVNHRNVPVGEERVEVICRMAQEQRCNGHRPCAYFSSL